MGEEHLAGDILRQAGGLVHGQRNDSYGHPLADLGRTGRLWGALLDEWRRGTDPDVPAELVALCMVALKLSREVHRHGIDNLVDAVGYVLCAARAIEARGADDRAE